MLKVVLRLVRLFADFNISKRTFLGFVFRAYLSGLSEAHVIEKKTYKNLKKS